ncbi:DNA-binding response regulator [Actinoalloteichus sp. AHMU CJ021]|uniref:DNA-binding response regulator, NarL/FixJ family, contains REC and HTH domains n=1 Tax=Actinoalloteichus caeruleus DSM 43889 TaxID=1120930 RepID=A0ABT1JMS6_ACTCY|nr:response regulator transcription factor [Actinoalloteichus caeruleus]AUS81800.1 DNA-binding response regulator [Actinoalloteichus sp. AHMU CJ021]MCP2333816.1 DNA-binding response regulator, NarL/FixJ family, contains REC and HTH domains [Actinoalloteichus caeruleus DSM 43889]
MTVRVLLADDQAMVRAGLRTILEAEPDLAVVGEAADGDQAVREALRTRPDVLLLDVRMPGTDGITALERLADAGLDPPVSVLVVTTFDLDEYVFAALRAGASGFLLKDVEPDELVAAVRTTARGEGLISPRVTRRLIAEFARRSTDPPPREPTPLPAHPGLTEREREILVLVARGLSNAEIAATLVVGQSTVKTHVGNLLAKLGCRDRVQAVVLAYEHGLVRPGG